MKENSNTTLQQGLERFYKNYDGHLSHTNEGIPEEVQSFFMSHDVAHVLFGCDILLYGEGAVKIWTIFGTTLGFREHIRLYTKADAYELSKNFSFAHVVKNIFKLLFTIPVIIFRSGRMTKPWPWTGYDDYLDTPISEIRKKYNIQVL